MPGAFNRDLLLFSYGGDVLQKYSVPVRRLTIPTRGGEVWKEAVVRPSGGTAFTRTGLLWTAGNNILRPSWFDTNGDGVLDTLALLQEDSRTNVVLWNRDMTNAAWVKTTMTPAKDQVGIDGVANSASSLLATGANATCLQAIVLANSARFQSVFIKRLVGVGAVQMTTDNGATWTAVALTAAWTRVSIPTQTLANPTVGFRLVTNGDKIAVDFVQNENGVFWSTPIATTIAAVQRSAEGITLPWPRAAGPLWMYLKYVDIGGSLTATTWPLFLGTANPARTGFEVAASSFNFYHQSTAGSVLSILSPGAPIVQGDLVELFGVLYPDGSVQGQAGRNGGTGALGVRSAAQAFDAAWAGNLLSFQPIGTVNWAAVVACKIGLGVESGLVTSLADARAVSV